jgi:hypothetical protein
VYVVGFDFEINPLLPNDIQAELQGAGFDSHMPQHMHQQITDTLVQTCSVFSLHFCPFCV